MQREGNPVKMADFTRPVQFPEKFGEKLNRFIADGNTGNVSVHIKDGKILGLTIEEKLSLR